MKKLLKVILILVLIIIFAAVALIAFLSVTEYKPAEKESLEIQQSTGAGAGGVDTSSGNEESSGAAESGGSGASDAGATGTGSNTETAASTSTKSDTQKSTSNTLSILSWNIGYGGLGKNAQFVMDGGKGNGTPSKEDATNYLTQIRNTVKEQDADINILQEVDVNSSRSYGVNQAQDIAGALDGSSWAHALNYSCKFVPYPWPPIGKVNSGLETISKLGLEDATRISLPCPFNWPVRVANLKRCLLVSHIKIPQGTLAVVNLHLEAYDDGEGKAAQTQLLLKVIEEEYKAGNYVIAGGDWNQSFPGAIDAYPIKESSTWTPGTLDESMLPKGWSFACSTQNPSCRLLNQPYNADTEKQQYYVIDGFVVSPNVTVKNIKTLDLEFQASDHNPVRLEVSFD